VADIIKFYPNGSAEDPDNVLEQAIGKYQDVLILGWDKDEDMDCRASLGLSHEQVLWIIIRYILTGEIIEPILYR